MSSPTAPNGVTIDTSHSQFVNVTLGNTTNKAIINWQSFDVGNGGAANFYVPTPNAAVLNRIRSGAGPNGASLIDGRVASYVGTPDQTNAAIGGNIYLINQNGVIFGQGSQIDVGTLTASTLNIQDRYFLGSLLDARNTNKEPLFQADNPASVAAIVVEPGARLSAHNSAGRVLLIGNTVLNGGEITVPPNGQVMLLGGNGAYIDASSDPSLRGLVAGVLGNGTVTNASNGVIAAPQGNITLAGLVVNQQGKLSATTSVNFNGSIYLTAGSAAAEADFKPTQGGTLRIGSGSKTEVRPELSDKATTVDANPFTPSRIQAQGKFIALEAGALVSAPGGGVTLAASDPAVVPTPGVDDGSKLSIASGSRIDVSGTRNVAVSVARNFVTADLRGNELQDSPLQRDGFLRGKSVVVDVRRTDQDGNIPLANVSGFTSNIGRTIAERTTAGGSIMLQSGGTVALAEGATLDASGGSLLYSGSNVDTTKLLGADGKVYDVMSAPKDLLYTGFADSQTAASKWVATPQTWRAPSPYEAGYVEGRDAGSISISGAHVATQASLLGSTVNGVYQRSPAVRAAGVDANHSPPSYDQVPLGGALSIFGQDMVLGTSVSANADTLLLSPGSIAANGIDRLSLHSFGSIAVPADTRLSLAPGGSLSLEGNAIDIAGRISVPSGHIIVKAAPQLAGAQSGAEPAPTVVVSDGARIEARGRWVNDALQLASGGTVADSLHVDGGSVSITVQAGTGGGGLWVDAASIIDVSGGGYVRPDKSLSAGHGGSIALTTFDDSQTMTLAGTLAGYAIEQGGSLSIHAPQIHIGRASIDGVLRDGDLNAAVFMAGGFNTYAIIGADGLVIDPYTNVLASESNFLPRAGYLAATSGSDLYGISAVGQRPAELREGVHVSLASTRALTRTSDPHLSLGNVLIGEGASVSTDTGGSIGLQAAGRIYVDGTLQAPAGTIDLAISNAASLADSLIGYRPEQTIWLGTHANLLAPAAALVVPRADGLRFGNFVNEGANRVTLSAPRGYIVSEPGSLIDVSGSTVVLDVAERGPIGVVYRRETIAGNAGSVILLAREGMLLDGTFDAAPGGAGALGGTFTATLDRRSVDTQMPNGAADVAFPDRPSIISISTTATALPAGLHAGDPIGDQYNGRAAITTDTLAIAGLSTVRLAAQDRVEFDGAVTLQATRSVALDTPRVAVAQSGNADAVIAAQQVELANRFSASVALDAAIPGTTLNVHAGVIDVVGNPGLSGFETDRLSSTGAIRLSGTQLALLTPITGQLESAGDLILRAADVYPTTLSQFDLVSGTRIRVEQAGTSAGTPLSAGAGLTLDAPVIEQCGTLRAPLGEIQLGTGRTSRITLAADSVTSVSAAGSTLIPFGSTQNQHTWVYSTPGQLVSIAAPPAKTIHLRATNIAVAEGAIVDLRGGGDLLAYEFIPGTGGSRDVLATAGTFAIVPTLGTAYAPIDPQIGTGSTLQVGDAIYFPGNALVPAGYYTLLPAHYALLSGGIAVRAASTGREAVPGLDVTNLDGSIVVAGKRAVLGTGFVDARWSNWTLTPGAVVRAQTEFAESTGNAFFGTAPAVRSAAPRLPRDAGQLVLDSQALTLQSSRSILLGAAEGGRGGELDLLSNRIAVVDDHSASAPNVSGFLQLDARTLSELGAASLLIGGTRTHTESGVRIITGASEVEVDNAARTALQAGEVILVATDRITMGEGSAITASGSAPTTAELQTSGDGALLRVAGGEQPVATRTGSTGASGNLEIKDGAALSGNSIILDATRDTRISTKATLTAENLTAAASRISLSADGTGPSDGLTLSAHLLASANTLALRSYTTIDLYGALSVGAAGTGPTPESITLDSAAIQSMDAGTKQIGAQTVVLKNSGAACGLVACGSGTGGAIVIVATADNKGSGGSVELGDGKVRIDSAEQVELGAAREIVGTGQGSLETTHDLTLTAARISARGTSEQTFAAGGKLATALGTSVQPLAPAPIGGTLTLRGSDINHGGNIDMPAGTVNLTARTGDVQLRHGSRIDVRGVTKSYFDAQATAPAGTVHITSEKRNIAIASGARIDVSGAPGGDAGEVTLTASAPPENAAALHHGVSVPQPSPQTPSLLVGTATGGGRGGVLKVDVDALPSLAGLMSATTGFTQEIDVRTRSGDITTTTHSSPIVAQHVELAADRGKIDIASTIKAQGGSIALWGGIGLSLMSTAKLLAQGGDDGLGGRIVLGTASGSMALVSGALIDVHGAAEGGEVRLRAPRIGSGGNPDVAITDLSATFDLHGGAANGSADGTATIEAVRIYNNPAALNTAFLNSVANDNDALMQRDTAILARLGRAADARFHLEPGVEVRTNTALTVAQNLDFASLRAGGEAGVFTVRSSKAITVNGRLSDGFTDATSADLLPTGPSWSYRLVAGADLGAADPLALATPSATIPAADLTFGANSVVRTGTGSIDVTASGNVILSGTVANAAALYTAGTPAAPLAGFDVPDTANDVPATYSENGGDITVTALGDVRGAASRQLFNQWLFRRGQLNADGYFDQETPQSSWWISFADFKQDVGALGGGNVSVRAGGDVRNLSVSIPTNGRQAFGRVADGAPPSSGDLVVLGGGDLDVRAAGNIASGAFFVGRGHADIRAGGDIVADTTRVNAFPLLLALGDATFDVHAGGALTLGTAFNPTLTSQSTRNFENTSSNPNTIDANLSYFTTYGADSGINLSALRGDLTLPISSTAPLLRNAFPGYGATYRIFPDEGSNAFRYLPPSLTLASMLGDVTINGGFTLYPAGQGNLTLLSARNVALNGSNYLQLSDASPDALGTPAHPITQARSVTPLLNSSPPAVHAPQPVHADDKQPVRIYAADGDITSTEGYTLVFGKHAQIEASGDIVSLSMLAQNIKPTDVTSVIAGGSIRYPLPAPDSSTGQIPSDFATLDIAGPGWLEVLAGRSIDLGASVGIVTRGNLTNPALAPTGAGVLIAAGLGQRDGVPVLPDLDAFLARYVVSGGAGTAQHDYSSDLIAYMTGLGLMGDVPSTAPLEQRFETALARYRDLGALQQMPFITQVFSTELTETGRAHTRTGADYQRGYDAIATLFPGQSIAYDGDLTLYYSQIRTLSGGDVDLLVPGGLINVGLANIPPNAPTKQPQELGIVAQQSGSIRSFSSGDVLVNTSRVFSVGGGDVTIWTTFGDIDAGKGAKTTIIVPPPVVTIDSAGNLQIQLPNGATGAGIGTLLTGANQVAGDVDLIAPAGTVNAGDAGIRASGNIAISALQVINAGNIQFGGQGLGIPFAPDTSALNIGIAAAANTATNATRGLDSAIASGAATPVAAATPPPLPTNFLSVEVLGFGCRADDERCREQQ